MALRRDDGEYQKDPRTGELTGMLLGTAGERQEKALPPPSRARTLIAARNILAELNSYGITSIHDIARVDEISQTKIFHTHLERSFSDLSIFTDLRSRGELTVRVYPILTLRVWQELVAKGFKPGGGDDLIRFGALKALLDGFYMFEPYANNPNFSGGLTFRVVDEQTMENDIIGADAAGFDPAVHVIGDKAHFLLLNWYEAAIRKNARPVRLDFFFGDRGVGKWGLMVHGCDGLLRIITDRSVPIRSHLSNPCTIAAF